MRRINSKYNFNKINVLNAWLLGFVFADGTIGFQSEKKILKIYNIDKLLLENIKIKYELPYKVTKQKNTNNVVYFIRIGDTGFINSLENLGFKKDKSKLRVPNMSSECAKLFLKGFLKGKGSFFKETKSPNYGFKVVYRSESCIIDIAKLISYYCNVRIAKPHCRVAKKTISCEIKYTNSSCDNIAHFLNIKL